MRIGGVWVGWGLGDNSKTDFRVRDFKRWADRMYSKPPLRDLIDALDLDSNLFDSATQAFVIQLQRNLVGQGKLPEASYPTGFLDEDTQLACGFLKPKPKPPPEEDMSSRPVIFTVEGHMSNMEFGPAAEVGKILQAQRVCQWQPIGYDSVKIPFDNDGGIDALLLQIDRLIRPFPNRKFGLSIYSQGGIIGSRTYREHIVGTDLEPRLTRTVAFGNPYREKGVVRPGMPNPPQRDYRGIADERMENTPSWWWEFAHKGDIYTAVPDNDAGEHMTAIYEIVQGNWTKGQNAILKQVIEIFGNPTWELIQAAIAISNGVMFLGRGLAPHGGFDIGPAIEHMRSVGV